jgi:hypothetical protein
MKNVLVEVSHDGAEIVEAATLEEFTCDEAGGKAGDEAGGDCVTTADEDDATTGEDDAATGEDDATADEDDEAADEADETADDSGETSAAGAAAADDVPKISFCAPSWNPQLLLYAGLLGLPLWSVPLTTMLFPSAWFQIMICLAP